MKRLYNYISGNSLLKVASYNSLSMVVRLLSGFISVKVIALFVGAEGMALIGNLRNFLNAIKSVVCLGFYNGLVKYTAELKQESVVLAKTISTAVYVSLGVTFLASIGIFIFSEDISNFLLLEKAGQYSYIIKLFAVALPFYTLNTLFLAVLNGFSKFKTVVVVNTVGQLLATALTVYLVWKEQLSGALISVVLAEVFVFILTFFVAFKHEYVHPYLSVKKIKLNSLKGLSSYSVMALFSAVVLPLTTVLIRNLIIQKAGLEQAGYWEAITRISDYYLLFISSLLTLYVLPKFSEITTNIAFRKEVFKFYKSVLPLFGIGLVVIYFFREFIIEILFTKNFYPVKELFFWQLLGDFFKVLSLVIAYQFWAKKMIWHYLITEAISLVILYASSVYFVGIYNEKGAVIAHFVCYVCYCLMILGVFYKPLFGESRN